jgi:hypothetical protein
MKKGLKITLIVLCVLIALLIIAWFSLFTQEQRNFINPFSCVQAGDVFENPSLGPDDGNFGKCCEGLIGIGNKIGFDENCEFSGMVGMGSICSDCGNGICEEWESKCNCEIDCN